MYLHIGQNWLVPYSDIIGIFQYELLMSSPEFRQPFHRWRVEGRVWGDGDNAKTVIITDDTLYLSTISANTLLKRVLRQELQFE